MAKDTVLVLNHPLLKAKARLMEVVKAITEVERSKLLPDLSLGFFNTTIKDIGPDNILYNGATRFNSGQIGVALPIFAGAQRPKIKAAKIVETEIANGYLGQKQELQKQDQAAVFAYRNHSEALIELEKVAYTLLMSLKNKAEEE